jgi:hypothetical protein
MRHVLHEILAGPVNVGWKVLTALTALSMLEMTRNLLRRIRHIFP